VNLSPRPPATKHTFQPETRSVRFDSLLQHVVLKDGSVYVPKLGGVKVRQSQPIGGQTKSATCKRTATGKCFVTLVTEFDLPE
jgi:putative transposase